MKHNTTSRHAVVREGGNAVTLTLLGLAVAILAGVGVLYYIGKNTPQPVATPTLVVDTTVETQEEIDPREGWNTYRNDDYHYALEYPDGWAVATGTLFGDPTVSVYLAAVASGTPPFSHLDIGVPHVSAYPRGLATEGLFSDRYQSSIIIEIPRASAFEYRVSNGSPWGTMVAFDAYPESWTSAGFLFASASIEELEIGCMRGDVGIDIDSCQPFEGDRTVIHGFVNRAVRDIEMEILNSFRFVTVESTTTAQENAARDLITVTNPTDNMLVTSPLTVSGEARGPWYFEASFPVRLETASGEVLAQVPATALDDWMTENYVPFEVSLAFGTTTATSGSLILSNANASGMPLNDMSVTIPVRF